MSMYRHRDGLFWLSLFSIPSEKEKKQLLKWINNVTLTTLLSGLPVKCSNYPAWDIPSIGLTIHVCKPHASMLLSSL